MDSGLLEAIGPMAAVLLLIIWMLIRDRRSDSSRGNGNGKHQALLGELTACHDDRQRQVVGDLERQREIMLAFERIIAALTSCTARLESIQQTQREMLTDIAEMRLDVAKQR